MPDEGHFLLWGVVLHDVLLAVLVQEGEVDQARVLKAQGSERVSKRSDWKRRDIGQTLRIRCLLPPCVCAVSLRALQIIYGTLAPLDPHPSARKFSHLQRLRDLDECRHRPHPVCPRIVQHALDQALGLEEDITAPGEGGGGGGVGGCRGR